MAKNESNTIELARAMGSKMPTEKDLALRKHVEGRLIGLRVNRYSWWVHARELADFFLPRRYKWLVTPNQMGRGSPINQHILDSSPTLSARNLASGIMFGVTNPTSPWFRFGFGRVNSTSPSPVGIWLKQVEEMMMLVFQESNLYQSLAVLYFDLVIFGTASLLIYEDYDSVIACFNPCFGEFYCDCNENLKVDVFYREFVYTVTQTVDRWGIENVSPAVAALYKQGGASLTRELVIAHAIEPNNDHRKFGVPVHFAYREVYWEWGGSASPQGGASYSPGLLEKRGFFEKPHIIPRWDTVANDAYGRSPAMDALPDCKQLQLQVRRQAQGIDKQVNPPLQADIQLKNQPASLIPGGVTYVAGLMSSANPGMQSIYNHKIELGAMTENLEMVRERIKKIFFNDLFQTITQYQTRSNVTAEEINARRAESLIMLGPVLERLQDELLAPIIERTFGIMSRKGILPPAPPEIAGQDLSIQYISMLSIAQQGSKTAGIDKILGLAGNLAGIDPAIVDKLDLDYAFENYNFLLNNDPRLLRPEEAVQQIRAQRQQAQQQAVVAQQADTAQKLAAGAQTASQIPVGGGKNALQAMLGGAT